MPGDICASPGIPQLKDSLPEPADRLADLNPPRFGLFTFVQRDGQPAVFQLGVDFLIVDRRCKRKAAEEAEIAPPAHQPVSFRPIPTAVLFCAVSTVAVRGL